MNINIKPRCSSFSAISLSESANLSEVVAWLPRNHEHFSPKRKQEWLAGRFCAKVAARSEGVALDGLPNNVDRSPDWPKGLVGSISHNDDMAIALVSKRAKAVGIDCEKIISSPLFEKIKDRIISETEEKVIAVADHGATLAFSCKEALFKALYPRCDRYFDFLDAQLLSFDEDQFLLRLQSQDSIVGAFNGVYQGGFTLAQGNLISWLELL